jgi:hypothetical protein
MPDPSLLMLLDEVRGKTLEVLAGVTDRQARWAPTGLQNTILWHAGHSYVATECLTMEAVGREPQLPAGWFETFSWESRPGKVSADRWPMLADVLAQLRAQHARLRAVIAELTEDQLDSPLRERPDTSVRYRILHALHDEACHTGEIWLLRKMQHAAG